MTQRLQSCRSLRAKLALLAIGALAGPEKAAMEAHLAECAGCQRHYGELKGVSRDLHRCSQDLARAKPSAGFRLRWIQAVKNAEAPGLAARVIAWVKGLWIGMGLPAVANSGGRRQAEPRSPDGQAGRFPRRGGMMFHLSRAAQVGLSAVWLLILFFWFTAPEAGAVTSAPSQVAGKDVLWILRLPAAEYIQMAGRMGRFGIEDAKPVLVKPRSERGVGLDRASSGGGWGETGQLVG